MPAPWPDLFKTPWTRACVTLLLVVAPGATRATPKPAVGGVGLLGVRFGGDSSSTRVVLDLDAAIDGKIIVAESVGGHIVLTVPPMLSTGAMRGPGRGLVKTWSVSGRGGAARLELEVAPGATAAHRFLIAPTADGPGPWRYVIDIKPAAAGGDPAPSLAMNRVRPERPQAATISLATMSAPTPKTSGVKLLSAESGAPLSRVAVSFHANAPASGIGGAARAPGAERLSSRLSDREFVDDGGPAAVPGATLTEAVLRTSRPAVVRAARRRGCRASPDLR